MRSSGILEFAAPRYVRNAAEEKTVIVTGVSRAGTSMIAALLDKAGLPLGDQWDPVVFEDKPFHDAFNADDFNALAKIIEMRNIRYGSWAVKRPNMHLHGPRIIKMFRNPLLIATIRDPIAVASRIALSEQVSARDYLVEASINISQLLQFALDADCPVLLVSYEKALSNPQTLVAEICKFCGLKAGSELRLMMEQTVVGDHPDYILHARRRFDGYVDCIEDGCLAGWAWQVSTDEPVSLDILIDGQWADTTIANLYRSDLEAAGIGCGHHGFRLPLRGGLDPSATIDVQICGRTFFLGGSGAKAIELQSTQSNSP